jgi:hypothetical protein
MGREIRDRDGMGGAHGELDEAAGGDPLVGATDVDPNLPERRLDRQLPDRRGAHRDLVRVVDGAARLLRELR